jgi:YD repeat-containing protein
MHARYTYDANGSQTSKTTGTGSGQTTAKYLWDLRNRMVAYDGNGDDLILNAADGSTSGSVDDAGDAAYGYDEQGQRISQKTGTGDTTYYLNDRQNPTGYPQILEEKAGTSPATATLARSYVIGLRVEGQIKASTEC